jgi:penicillin amidase
VHAQERSWQLAFNRRIMHGTLSEILGPATLETDRLMRTLDIMGAADRQYQGLPPAAREALQKYSDGINAFFVHSDQALPPEFQLIRAHPERNEPAWTPQDSVGWALMMALDLGGNWGTESTRFSLLRTLTTQQLWELMPPYPGETQATTTDLAALYRQLGVYKDAAKAEQTSQHTSHGPWSEWSRQFVAQAGEPGNKGSNNWVLSGARTRSGKPLLANDPHLDLSAPAVWYFASLEAPAGKSADGMPLAPLKVMGATLPGLPFVVLGRTDTVAWAFTNTGPDVQDLYLEQLDPANPQRVRTPQGWQDIETRTEVIRVKGQADEVIKVRRTRHGPVISDAMASYGQYLNLDRFVVALRWSALDSDNQSVLAGLLSNQASNVDELFQAFSHHHSPMQSALAADTHGAIRMHAVGRAPLRAKDNDLRGVAPAPGWLSKYDWQGWIPFEDNPRDSGAQGWVATANQRVVPPDYPHHLTQDWVLPYRYERIVEMIHNTPVHDVASMKAMQADVRSAATLKFLPYFRQARSSHPLAQAALAALKDFDGQIHADRAAPLITAVWIDEVTRALLEPVLGAERLKALYGKRTFRAGIEGMLSRNDPAWCGAQGCQEVIDRALGRALDRISALQGTDVGQWQWGKSHVAKSAHRPFDRVPVLARWFDVRQPSAGEMYTVNVGQYFANEEHDTFANRQAASMRAIYDLADLEQSLFIYQTGQSGVVFSDRYRDMAHEWANGQYRPLQFKPPLWRHELTLKPAG